MERDLHSVHDDLQMQLAHALDGGLAGLLVSVVAEGRILLAQAVQGQPHLLLVRLGLGLHGDLDHGGGELHALQNHRVVRVAQGVARHGVLQSHDGHDVAGPRLLHLRALVSYQTDRQTDRDRQTLR